MNHNLAEIRQQLRPFSLGALLVLCYDQYPAVYRTLKRGQAKDAVVAILAQAIAGVTKPDPITDLAALTNVVRDLAVAKEDYQAGVPQATKPDLQPSNRADRQGSTSESQGYGGLSIDSAGGDITESTIAGGDVHQTINVGNSPNPADLPQQNLVAQLTYWTATNLPQSQAKVAELQKAIAQLPQAEAAYRQRLRDRYQEDASYYVPLKGETTEIAQQARALSRSARRRQQRVQAEYRAWVPEGPEIKRVKLTTLREGVMQYPCIILLGEPGSGKSTALENLAYQFADDSERLPLPLKLSEFQPGMTLDVLLSQGWGGTLESGHWGASDLVDNLYGYLEAGRLFILFDALNEMPQDGYAERVAALRGFIDTWSGKGNRFLVTCRVLDYGQALSGLQRVEIQPLSDDQNRSRTCRAKAESPN